MSEATWGGRRCRMLDTGEWIVSAVNEPDNLDVGTPNGGKEAVAGCVGPKVTALVPLPDSGPLLIVAGRELFLLDGPPEDCNKWVISPLKPGKPDGEEPADSQWAESVGFQFSDRDEMYKYVLPGCNLKVVLTGDLGECEKDRHLSLHWSNWPNKPQHSGSLSVDDNPTRDRVRLLFAGLGCPLEEKEV